MDIEFKFMHGEDMKWRWAAYSHNKFLATSCGYETFQECVDGSQLVVGENDRVDWMTMVQEGGLWCHFCGQFKEDE